MRETQTQGQSNAGPVKTNKVQTWTPVRICSTRQQTNNIQPTGRTRSKSARTNVWASFPSSVQSGQERHWPRHTARLLLLLQQKVVLPTTSLMGVNANASTILQFELFFKHLLTCNAFWLWKLTLRANRSAIIIIFFKNVWNNLCTVRVVYNPDESGLLGVEQFCKVLYLYFLFCFVFCYISPSCFL